LSVTLYEIMNIAFTLTVIGGLLWAYASYISEKGDRLKVIESGKCPKCKQESMELADQRGGGCSGTKLVIYECTSCGYSDSFNVDSSCSSGKCRL